MNHHQDNWPFDRPLWRQRVETWGIGFAVSTVLVAAGYLFAVLLTIESYKVPPAEVCPHGPPSHCARAESERSET